MTSPLTRRIAVAAALALSLVALLALLAGPAQARRRAACSSSAHSRQALRACNQARRVAMRAKRRAAQRRHAKHTRSRGGAGHPESAPGARTAPSCEGGEAPVRGRGGALSCADGSEPACPQGMSLESEGASIFCAPGAETEAEFDSEGTCEAASSGACGPARNAEPVAARCPGAAAPLPSGGESFTCPDGSLPQCGEGLTPTPSSDGSTVVCVAVLTAEPTP